MSMSSNKRGGGLVIAMGLLGAACTRQNLAYDEEASGGQTGGTGNTGTVGDGTVTTGRPGDGSVGSGSVDGGSEGSTICASDEECDDGEFCNGVEVCSPSDPGADDFGCMPASEPRCSDGANCIEELQECVTDCDLGSDADLDGFDAVECGGDDCDDSDEFVYPQAPEICDDVDDDCNPLTLGDDDDGDREVSNECCNPTDDGFECGADCDDSELNIIGPGGDWAHCSACNLPCETLQACQAGVCIDARRVFVSSSVQAGDMGGLEGADDICQGLADSERLGGSFQAYIRDAETTLVSRLEQATVPYVRLDGVRIADDWGDLIDGSLQAPLYADEQREHHMELFDRAWTGLQPEGVPWESDCGGWTSTIDAEGAAGDVPSILPFWQANGLPHLCSSELRLYCIEQDGGG